MISTQKLNYVIRKVQILSAIDLNLEAGNLHIIIGPNGAGKSSLLNLLANEVTKHRNEIFFQEKSYTNWNLEELSKVKSKFSQQFSHDIPMTVFEVVMMGRYPYFKNLPQNADLDAAKELMQAVEIWNLKDREYNTLSGGEKQRVHLARCLCQVYNNEKQKMILLDEPLNNLDVRHQYKILELLKIYVRKGFTIVAVLHDLNLAAKFADKVILMKDGFIKYKGSSSEVFNEEIISEIYGFPCQVIQNPLNDTPIILFGN